MRNKIFLLIGKSSVGKTVIEQELGKLGVHRAISYTSRPKRSSEVDGDEYFFVDNNKINEMLENNELYELTKYTVGGELWQYALAKDSFNAEKMNVATVNPDGMNQLLENKELSSNIRVILITASDETRERRYLERETNPNKVNNWKERKKQDEKDFVIDQPFKNVKNLITVANEGDLSIEEISKKIYNIMRKEDLNE